MNIDEQSITVTRGRSDSVHAEQALCNEALQSGNFDTMSDTEWIELCRRAAAGEPMESTSD